jgi:tetratricopeptide (TPR) repeat protein
MSFIPIDLLLSVYSHQRIPVDFEVAERLVDEKENSESIKKMKPLLLQELKRVVEEREQMVGGKSVMERLERVLEQNSAIIKLADMAFRRGQLSRAAMYYERIFKECLDDRAETELKINLSANIAHCYRFMNDNEKALESYLGALQQNEQSINVNRRVHLLKGLALVYKCQRRYKQAFEAIDEALSLCPSEHVEYADLLFAKGEIYQNQHLLGEALPLLLQGFELRLEQKNPSAHPASIARMHFCLSAAFDATEQYKEALGHAEKAWALIQRVYPDGCFLDLIRQYEQNVADIRFKLHLPFDRHMQIELSKTEFDGRKKYTHEPYSDDKGKEIL